MDKIIENWIKKAKQSYLEECEDEHDALHYIVNDCIYELHCRHLRNMVETIARNELGIQ